MMNSQGKSITRHEAMELARKIRETAESERSAIDATALGSDDYCLASLKIHDNDSGSDVTFLCGMEYEHIGPHESRLWVKVGDSGTEGYWVTILWNLNELHSAMNVLDTYTREVEECKGVAQ